MTLLRRLPPVPDHMRDTEPLRDGVDVAAFLRGAAAPLATRFKARAAWSVTRAALRAGDWVADLSEAALLDGWHRAASAARRGDGHAGLRLAYLREITHRVTGMLPHPVQLVAATALSDRTGVEMATGEGKTLVTIMAAALQAAEGWPVHVITANDHLALRDHAAGQALFRRLSLTSGGIDPDASPPARRAVYGCDIVYASAKEIAFDHLKDRIAHGDATALGLKIDAAFGTGQPPIMRGLWSAIVDEADSVLIDEARTPLVISAPSAASDMARIAAQAVALARRLRPGLHFTQDRLAEAPVKLTPEGGDHVVALAAALGGVWASERRTRDLVQKALYALHHLTRDVHYILVGDKVEIVDENTGRIMADRTWSEGLHTMVEVKEGLPPGAERATLGRLTFQRFFRRYLRLSGLSGTLAEAARELRATYDLTILPVPPHRPSQRAQGRIEILPDLAAKWARVAVAAGNIARRGGRC